MDETQLELEPTHLSRELWFELARATFAPGKREPCAACGKYVSIAHAHHVIPLAKQWAERRLVVDHSHVWLCPNHHAVVHALIEQYTESQQSRSRMLVVIDFAACEPEILLDLARIALRGAA